MKKLIKIHESGNTWKITGVETREDYVINPKLFYDCSNNEELFNIISNELSTNNISIDKSKLGFNGAYITKYDLIKIPIDKFDFIKNNISENIYNIIQDKYTFIDQFEVFNFIESNNYLISNGFILTDENLNEQVNKIIDLNNTENISYLNKYLESKKYLNKLNILFKIWKNLNSKLEMLDTEEQAQLLSKDTIKLIEEYSCYN